MRERVGRWWTELDEVDGGGTLHSSREMIYLTTNNIPFLGAGGFIGSPLFGGAVSGRRLQYQSYIRLGI